MTLGKKIAELRKKYGYSQEELARRMNVSRQTISKWETDMSLPDIERLKELSKILQVSLNELLDIEEDQIIDQNELQAFINQMMIIQENYEKETQKRKQHQTIILIGTIIVLLCLCIAIGLLFMQLHNTNKQLSILSSDLSQGMNHMETNIEKSIQESLNNKESLLTDFAYKIEEINLQKNKIKIHLQTTLKESYTSSKVQFVFFDQNFQQYSYQAICHDGIYEYDDYISLINIAKLSIKVMNQDQILIQSFDEFQMSIPQYQHNLKVNYIIDQKDNAHGGSKVIKAIGFCLDDQDKETYEESLTLWMTNEQIENNEKMTIIYDDFKISKIDYQITYNEKIYKQETLKNNDQDQLQLKIDKAISNGDNIIVEGYVYDQQGNRYRFYNHSQYNVLSIYPIDTIESQEILVRD